MVYNRDTDTVKLLDFGFACVSKDKLKVFCGTPSYMSPEVTANQVYSGPPSDVWASGICLYTMVCGQFPFRSATEKDLFKQI
mmetsp:Transcript_86124/g.118772  ORF Transcript_86124/g.118772 Transcript_86124/m.118772 type:complete len:82 (+) Transcript_86124:110-355(+)